LSDVAWWRVERAGARVGGEGDEAGESGAATTTQIAVIVNILRRTQGVRCRNRCEFGAAGQLVGGVQPGGGVQLSAGRASLVVVSTPSFRGFPACSQ